MRCREPATCPKLTSGTDWMNQSPVLLAANDLVTSADISSSLMRGFINVVIFEILLILITTLKREVLIINPFWDEQSENMGR